MAGLEDREVLTDHRHIAFVVASERSTIFTLPDTVRDDTPDKSALLNRCLRHSGDGVTILSYCGCITNDKDVRCLGNVHESANGCAPGAVRRRSQHFHDRRGANARSPKYGRAGNAGASRNDALFVDLLDFYAGRNVNAEFG